MKKLLLVVCLAANTGAFAKTDSTSTAKHTTGNHTISILPGAFTYVEGVHSSVGLGVSYEYRLPGMPNLSIGLPLMITFSDGSDFYSYGGNNIYGGIQYRSLSTTPFVKLLLGKSSNRVRYGVGGSFFYEYGKKPELSILSRGQFDPFGVFYSVYGAVINNSLNVYPTQHLSICFNSGIGMAYNTKGYNNGIAYPFPWIDTRIMQFTVAIGYRF